MIIIPNVELDPISDTTKVELSLVKSYKPWLDMIESINDIVEVNLILKVTKNGEESEKGFKIPLAPLSKPCSTLCIYTPSSRVCKHIYESLDRLEVVTNDGTFYFDV